MKKTEVATKSVVKERGSMKKRKKQPRQTRRVQLKILLLSVLLASVIVIGSTYAWVTWADTRINHVASGRVEIIVEGKQTPERLTPLNKESPKELTVRNEATMPAIVRVSLEEVLLTFAVDTTDQKGNGHLKEQTSAAANPIKVEDSGSWQMGATLEQKEGGQVYVIGEQRVNYVWNPATPRPELLQQSVSVEMPHVVKPTDPIPTGSYWLYYEGYFYYSEALEPGQSSAVLVSSTKLAPKAPNRVKGSLYELTGKGEGYSATLSSIIYGFQLPDSSPVYQRFKDKLY